MTLFFHTLMLLLNKRGITKNEFLKEMNISESTFSEWGHNEIIPDGNTLLEIAIYLDTSVDYLLAYYKYPNVTYVKSLKRRNEIYHSACYYYHEKLQKLSLPENPKRIILNTETTGLDASEDEILQLSIIDENAEILYNQYFQPEKVRRWCEAQAVNGISPEMVKDCPPIWREQNKIQSIIDSADIIIGYNTSFDMEFLFHSEIFSTAKIVDVMEDFAKIYGEWSEYFDSYKWQKLSVCAEYYHYDWGNDKAHDCLTSCRATLHCYKEMQKK